MQVCAVIFLGNRLRILCSNDKLTVAEASVMKSMDNMAKILEPKRSHKANTRSKFTTRSIFSMAGSFGDLRPIITHGRWGQGPGQRRPKVGREMVSEGLCGFGGGEFV